MQMRTTARLALLLAALGTPACALDGELDEVGSTEQESHIWNGFHWARQTPTFRLELGDSLTAPWKPLLATASADWSQSSVLDSVVVASGKRPRPCQPSGGRGEVCNAAYGRNGWLGIAQVWIDGSHITQGIVKLNDTYFAMAQYDSPAWRNLVMCQEVGHLFGLDHQDEDFGNTPLGTCMDYSNDPEPNQHPDAHDFAQLEEIYAHLDDTTTVGVITTLRPNDFEEPSSWGELVRSHEGGHSETYHRSLGGGFGVVTHVLWAE